MQWNEYSAYEQQIIEHFKLEAVAENVSVGQLYTMLVEKAFLNNDQTKYTQALRAAVHARNKMISRMTPEFESRLEEWLK